MKAFWSSCLFVARAPKNGLPKLDETFASLTSLNEIDLVATGRKRHYKMTATAAIFVANETDSKAGHDGDGIGKDGIPATGDEDRT